MSHEQIIQAIKARRAELATRQTALRDELQRLDQQDRDLEITERTLARLLPGGEPISVGAVAVNLIAQLQPVAPSKRQQRKPKGTPSIIRMAHDVLREMSERGQPWVDANAIVAEIRGRWWPEVEPELVKPALWRAATRQGKLLKDGALYALPGTKENGPAAFATGPSQNGATETQPLTTALQFD